MKKLKLAEALLLRKELQEKVDRLRPMDRDGMFEVKMQRKAVTDSVDDIIAAVPRISMQQVTHAFDAHAKRLRKVDAAIQQANWATEIEVDDEVVADYVDPYVEDKKGV